MCKNRPFLRSAVAAIVLAGPVSLAAACSFFGVTSLLVDCDDSVLWSPRSDLLVEINRIEFGQPAGPTYVAPDGAYHGHTRQTAREQLAEAIGAAGLDDHASEKALKTWDDARQAIGQYRVVFDKWQEDQGRWYGSVAMPAEMVFTPPVLGDGLPEEFELYLRGAIAYYAEDHELARKLWRQLLSLPADRRRYRSVWAAFMLGRSYLNGDPAEALAWFEKTRALAEAEFPDPLGLAVASLGRQGQALLRLNRHAEAIGLYYRQHRAGDPVAMWSLRTSVRRLFDSEDASLVDVAKDDLAQQVVTAVLVARGGRYYGSGMNEHGRRWLEALEQLEDKSVWGAERLAWVAYQCGQMDHARRWVARADAESAIAQWVRAKLLLRDGDVEAAMASLSAAVQSLRECPGCKDGSHHMRWLDDRYGRCARENTSGELAVMKLSTADFVGALDLFLRSDWWEDAAYVAERVLTVEELIAHVDQNWTAEQATNWEAQRNEHPDATTFRSAWRIRFLLARRLTRLKRWDEARAYYPNDQLRARLDIYVEGLEAEALPAADRAEALWRAAKTARWYGMSLIGAELAPDGTIYRGNGGHWDMGQSRLKAKAESAKLGPSADEEARWARHRIEPDKRFHYRYIASEIAWRAAELLPDGSDRTAHILCQAGSWLKTQDPDYADRFYKALVIRCGQTELGQEADRIRWFPKVDLERE